MMKSTDSVKGRSIRTPLALIAAMLCVFILVIPQATAPMTASAQTTAEGEISTSQVTPNPVTRAGSFFTISNDANEAGTIDSLTVNVVNDSTGPSSVGYILVYDQDGTQVSYQSLNRRLPVGDNVSFTVPISPQMSVTSGTPFEVRVYGGGGPLTFKITASGTKPVLDESEVETPDPTTTPEEPQPTPPAEPEPTSPEEPTSTEELPSEPVEEPGSDYGLNAIGSIEIGNEQVSAGNPGSIRATFTRDGKFEKAVFIVEAENGISAAETYTFDITQIEPGVTLQSNVTQLSADRIAIEVFPVRNGVRVPSATVPAGSEIIAVATVDPGASITRFQVDVYGELSMTELPEPQPVPDDYLFLPDAVQNPPLQQRCGQNIAIVFDVSGSLRNEGINAVKDAGHAVIDALAGTPANVGFFNFASVSPAVEAAQQTTPLSLSDPANVNTLRSKIDSLTHGQPAGTNWEGPLLQIYNSDVHYDAVFFVTDGMVSTNNAHTANDRDGYWTHTRDLADAINAANLLKQSGTHIEAFPVLMPESAESYPEYLLKDGVYPTLNHGNLDGWSRGEFAVGPGGGDWLGQGIDEGRVKVLNNRMQDVTIYKDRWSDGRLTPTQMIRQLLGPDQTDSDRYSINPVDNWQNLADELRAAVAAPCVANLVINKEIVDPEGNFLRDGAGWQFTAETGGENLVTRYTSNGLPDQSQNVQSLTRATDTGGRVEFGVDSAADLPVTVAELIPEDSTFSLYQQEGKNAVCTRLVFDANANTLREETVEVENQGANGFSLTMLHEESLGAVRSVECVVKNVESSSPKLKISKLEYDPETREAQEVDGLNATFTIFGSDADGNIDYDQALLELGSGGGSTATDLTSGVYWVVETNSPAGFQLLPQPLKLTLSFKDGSWSGSVENGGGLVFVEPNETADEVWINVANVRTGELPKTGGDGVWMWALFGVLFAGAGVLMARRSAS